MTISLTLHFNNYTMLQSTRKLRSWPNINPAGTFIHTWLHSIKHASHAILIELSQSMTFIEKLSPVVTFSILVHFMTYTTHQSMQKHTKIIPLSRTSWHIPSHMNASTQICITCNPNWIVTVYDISNKLSPVVTFAIIMHFTNHRKHQSRQKLTRIIPLSWTRWHIYSHMDAFTQICISCNPNWIVTVNDIFNELSPVATFPHIMHSRTYTMHQSLQKLTEILPLSHSSWHIHSHMNAFTQICITCNPNWIVTVYDILNKLSPVVTISHTLHIMNYSMHQLSQKLTQIMLLSQSSWHVHAQMNAFTEINLTCIPNWIVTVYDILNKLSPVVTFSHNMHFRTHTRHQSMQKLTQIIPLSRTNRHIHSHMNAFRQICTTCNPNWIVTVYDILNDLSPVVTFSNMHFKTYTMHQSLQKLTQIIQLSRASWHIHSHLNAITQICITCNPNWIVTVYDISNNLSSVVIFSHMMHFRSYTMHQSSQKPTQIITLSHCSWHTHSHMNAFTQICITCRSHWIVTVYDILNELSPVVTISHLAFQELYNASINAKSYSHHSPISIQLAHSFKNECIHGKIHYMQSQSNCHSLRHFKQMVTSCEICNHHAFHDLYNASVNAKTYSDHSHISNQLAHLFTHACLHANMHYMQSQLNSHSLWHFK